MVPQFALNRCAKYIKLRWKKPLELLSALSGHPVPHDTVFLDIMDVQTRKVVEYAVRKDVVSSFTRILKWSE